MPGRSSMLRTLFTRAVSLPIFFKIIGTGIIVACTFGSVVLYQSRQIFAVTLYSILEKEIKSRALLLASNIERPLAIGDFFLIKQRLHEVLEINPTICYGIVEDPDGRVLVHTFPAALPRDLQRAGTRQADRNGLCFEVLNSPRGLIFEAAAPLLHGQGGWLRLGLSDQTVTETLGMLSRLLHITLGFCMLMGMTLALYLTYLIARPVRNLLETTDRIGRGDFKARATVYFGDEIGKLAEAFNRMALNLEAYRTEVEEKEKIRQALLEKIVGIQEEERKRIARDLHDHLGQMLSVLLLDIQAAFESPDGNHEAVLAVQRKINGLIEEVRVLAWGLRPAILDDYGLDYALKKYVHQMGVSADMNIDYQYVSPETGLQRLAPEVEVVLYRIAQEAVTNVLRHAGPCTASILFIRNEMETVLLIEDDGRGFALTRPEKADLEHLGLSGMRERAALIGAEFTVESFPGKGTTVRIKLPAGGDSN